LRYNVAAGSFYRPIMKLLEPRFQGEGVVQTDGIAVASTALAMRRAVKMTSAHQ